MNLYEECRNIEMWNRVYLYKEGLCWTKILLKGEVLELRKLWMINYNQEKKKRKTKRKNKLKMGVNVG